MLSVLSTVCLILAESSVYSLMVLFCAAVHELGHVCAAKFLRAEICELAFLPFGAELKITGKLTYGSEILLHAAGPLFNLASGLSFLVVFLIFPCPYILFGSVCSFFLLAVNLVPASTLDGANIVRCLAFSHLEYQKALKASRLSELVSLVILTAVAVHTVIFCGFNLSVIGICIYLFAVSFKFSA
ncbi:MAG: hypothetical protein IKV97_06870 [Clostridia bacterium]|nr:hypothetical protein [Clostridia bacterium]